MNDKLKKVYLASGWWGERDERIIDFLEDKLSSHKGVKVYRPRKDGVKLSTAEFHDHNLRKSVFQSNVDNINSADFVLSNLDSGSDHLDTGTVWETAYAVGKGIPVMAYEDEPYFNVLKERLGKLVYCITLLQTGSRHFNSMVDHMSGCIDKGFVNGFTYDKKQTKSPVFLCDSTGNSDELVVMLDTMPSLRVVTDCKNLNEDTMNDILNSQYLIIPTDTKDPSLTFYMGLAYALGIPVFTYSSKGDPLNLMLIFSVVKHMTGIDDLKDTLSKILREGIDSFGEYDTSSMKVY